MLPVGHIASGYLTTKLVISALAAQFPQIDQPKFWIAGMVASILPDFDTFYSFAKIGGFVLDDEKANHRKYLSHAPLLHLGIGAVIWAVGAIGGFGDLGLYAILYVTGTMTHFFFDSFGYGIMWLWPLDRKIRAFHNNSLSFKLSGEPFWKFWFDFLKFYVRDLVFYLEIAVVILAVIVKLK